MPEPQSRSTAIASVRSTPLFVIAPFWSNTAQVARPRLTPPARMLTQFEPAPGSEGGAFLAAPITVKVIWPDAFVKPRTVRVGQSTTFVVSNWASHRRDSVQALKSRIVWQF